MRVIGIVAVVLSVNVAHAAPTPLEIAHRGVKNQLRHFYDDSRAYFAAAITGPDGKARTAQLPPSTPLTPSAACCAQPGGLCDGKTGYDAVGWQRLGGAPVRPQHYQYEYRSKGSGAEAKLTLRAVGDPLCDGHLETWEVTVAAAPGGDGLTPFPKDVEPRVTVVPPPPTPPAAVPRDVYDEEDVVYSRLSVPRARHELVQLRGWASGYTRKGVHVQYSGPEAGRGAKATFEEGAERPTLEVIDDATADRIRLRGTDLVESKPAAFEIDLVLAPNRDGSMITIGFRGLRGQDGKIAAAGRALSLRAAIRDKLGIKVW